MIAMLSVGRRAQWVTAGALAIGVINVALVTVMSLDVALNQLPYILAVSPMFVVAALITTRVPENPVGWLFLVIAVGGSFGSLMGLTAWNGLAAGFGAGLSTFGIAMLPLLLYLFPDGRLISPAWRAAAVVTLGVAILGGTLGLFVGGWGGSVDQAFVFSPLYETIEPVLEVTTSFFFLGFTGSFVASIISLVVRFRRGSEVVRLQLRWLMVGPVALLVAVAPIFASGDFDAGPSGWEQYALAAGLASLPVAIGVAVLRYRLYDIDVVISRSLTYGALAVFIGAVYVAGVVGVGALFGQGDQASFGLSIVATAVVALAFQPVRLWVERIANRVVFGERATPYEVLARFSRRAAEAQDDEFLERIPRLIVDGTGADRAALWIRDGDGFKTSATWPQQAVDQTVVGENFADPGADFSLPVVHDGELLGGVSLDAARGETITPSESRLLDDLVAGLGLALRNVLLTDRLRHQVGELERSRDRVVTAADRARRSLEHELDIGPQQQLVALKVKLGPIRKMAERAGAQRSASVLAQLEEAAGDAIASVRDFAGGVYPPLLEAEGLVVAIGHQSRRATLPIDVEADGVGRYPREVEAAVYFTILEALQNTTKYADASRLIVRLVDDGETLIFEIVDDGSGFDQARVEAGSGLANMDDRIDSVGGTLGIESEVGSGTSVRGVVPLVDRSVGVQGDTGV